MDQKHPERQSDRVRECVKLLITLKADVDAAAKMGTDWLDRAVTPAWLALPCAETLSLLIEARADVHQQNDTGTNLLHEAAIHHGAAAIELLIKHGATIRKNSKGITPFLLALTPGAGDQGPKHTDERRLATLKALRKASNFDARKHVNKTVIEISANPNESLLSTPLSKAIDKGFTKCVAYLLEQKADPNLPLDASRWGITVLCGARHYYHVENAKLLVAAGACTHPFITEGRLRKLSERRVPTGSASKVLQAKLFIKWAKTVEKPLVESCDKCGFDRRLGLQAKVRAPRAVSASAPASEPAKCANPLCNTPPATFQIVPDAQRGAQHTRAAEAEEVLALPASGLLQHGVPKTALESGAQKRVHACSGNSDIVTFRSLRDLVIVIANCL